MLKNVYVAGGVRTPFGSLGGALSSMSAAQLGSVVIRDALQRARVDGREVDEVLFGNVIQAGAGQNVARQASLGAGLGADVGATTINKVCGSAMRAVILAAQGIQCGDAHLVVAGGCESMSNAPYLLRKARGGYRLGHCGDSIDACVHDSYVPAPLNRSTRRMRSSTFIAPPLRSRSSCQAEHEPGLLKQSRIVLRSSAGFDVPSPLTSPGSAPMQV